MELCLMGAVHRDPDGKKTLGTVLEHLDPAAISLEVSPESIRLRYLLSRRWIKVFRERIAELARQTGTTPGRIMARSGPRGVYEYLRVPYEFRAAMDFARRRDRPLFLIDDSKLAASFLQRVEKELLTLKNLTALFEASANGDLGRETAVEYQRAAHKIFHPGELPETWWPKDSDMAARETGLAQKLRLLHQGLLRRDGKTISGEELTAALLISPEAVGHMPESVYLDPDSVHLYLGGWEHLVETAEKDTLYSRLKDLEPRRRLCRDISRQD